MYSLILQNLVKKLIENEFVLSSTFDTSIINQQSTVLLLKQESPILYVVSIVNGETSNLQNHETLINEYLQHLQKSLSAYRCSKIIALTIVIAEFAQQSEQQYNNDTIKQALEFVTTKELITQENYFYAWWYISQKRQTIEMEKSQPKDILHLRQIILDCLNNTQSQQNYNSFTEIITENNQKNEFYLKSDNILLTYHLLCINLFIFVCMLLFQAKENCIMLLGTEYHAIFDMHQYYRIITYCFIHSSVMHLVQNSVFLYFFGIHTEQLYGKIQMIMIYFLSAIGAGLFSALCNDGIAVGASGAIFGLIGAVLTYSYKHGKKSIGMNYMTLLLLVIIALLSGMLQQNVDYFGHFGGFVVGILVSFLLLEHQKRHL